MKRLFRSGSGMAAVLVAAGCNSTVVDSHRARDAGPTHGAGGAGGAGGSGGAGGAAGAPPIVDDSGTLDVFVRVNADGMPGSPDGQVPVELMVTVVDSATHQPVTDAVVTGGTVGKPFALPYDVYSLATYAGATTGYERTWEFSVVRGADHLTGLVLVGPSLPSVVVSGGNGNATIAWSPAHEVGVRTFVCVGVLPAADPSAQCAEASDQGSLVVAPVAPGDTVSVDRRTNVPVGFAGTGRVDVVVYTEVP